MTEEVDGNFVSRYVTSWESRHDKWVKDFLADAIGSKARTFHDIRLDLKGKLESDWRMSLGFFLERTTFQSRKDIVNSTTAIYLFHKIIGLPPIFDSKSLDAVIQQIWEEKRSGMVTHVREDRDIRRLESVARFVMDSIDKNLTQVVLGEIKTGRDIYQFLKQFSFVGDKTSAFYLKFLTWAFDLDLMPIVIDRHVMKALIARGEIETENPNEAREAILRLSKKLRLSPVKIETALYESSWQATNKGGSKKFGTPPRISRRPSPRERIREGEVVESTNTVKGASGEMFTVVGTVPDFAGLEFSLPVDNGDELLEWWRNQGIATKITFVAGKPTIKIRGRDVDECHPGQKIRHTIEVYDRNDKRCIRSLGVVSA